MVGDLSEVVPKTPPPAESLSPPEAPRKKKREHNDKFQVEPRSLADDFRAEEDKPSLQVR
eukprot:CAMPEP_0118919790 /NCGR_PEP_ID=MMETSP1166-20130328/18741_1 /TAXON_ID=1104430 /ORGANISM="Chrysoreinhardia sp, Strain CCMP3193" /LENGTH=59 /DNA_ID=CAMNT_0006860325 /DNA_START=33 /DNA_END=212 /DNA_ORIENTATION=+